MKQHKKTLRCRNCQSPLGIMDGDNIYIATHNKDGRNTVIIKIQHQRGGVVSVQCGRCDGIISPNYHITLVANKPKKKMSLTKE